MNEKHVFENECLSCQCGWPDEIRGEEIEIDDMERECPHCRGYGEIFDDSDLQVPNKKCEQCCGTGYVPYDDRNMDI